MLSGAPVDTRRRIAFRVDASRRMGTGHLRRCLTLAHELGRKGRGVVFVVRDLGTDNAATIRAEGFHAVILPAATEPLVVGTDLPPHAPWAEIGWDTDAAQTVAALQGEPPAALVVDHYAFDRRWHDAVSAALGVPLVAIDDLGDRPLAVAVIVDPTLADHARKHALSRSWKPRLLGGPAYALLGTAYDDVPEPRIEDAVKSVGIFMGGSDIANASEAAWRAARDALGAEVPITIATTSITPFKSALDDIAARDPGTNLVVDAPDLAGFFAAHDLQIGAGGGATWERCRVGAPTIVVAFVDNHLPVARPLHDMGVVHFSEQGATDAAALARDIAAIAGSQERRDAMSRAGRALVDGRGAQRIGEVIDELA